jgi:hypothetical protein
MGSITRPRRFVKETLGAIARIFVEDHVDLALMIPV